MSIQVIGRRVWRITAAGEKARFYADTQAAEPGAKMAAPPRCAGFTSISKDYFEMIRKVGRVSGGVM